MIDTAAIVWAIIVHAMLVAFAIAAGFRSIRNGLDAIYRDLQQ